MITPNRDAGIVVNDPSTTAERLDVAATCAIDLKIRIPVVVDEVSDDIARAYGALPDRLYLIDRDCRVAYQGDPGPWGFKPEELDAALTRLLD